MADTTSVITKTRREYLCKITSGAITTVPPIKHIAFGTGGVDSSGDPLVPSDTQTILNNEVKRYPINTVEYPTSTTARYTVIIPKKDMVGVKISEAGLVDANGKLNAIKNMYIKQKDEGVTFTFTFDDEF